MLAVFILSVKESCKFTLIPSWKSARIHFTFCPLEDAVDLFFHTPFLGDSCKFLLTMNLKSNKITSSSYIILNNIN